MRFFIKRIKNDKILCCNILIYFEGECKVRFL